MTPRQYIDLQVNGYSGVDFNADDLTDADFHRACEALHRDGAAGVLATIVTDPIEVMERRLRRIAALREADDLARQVILGIHVEGPFINEGDGFRGAHNPHAIRPADEPTMARLLDAGGGLVRLVTLAPERDAGMRVTRMLAKRGVVVSAGHCEARLDDLDAAIDAGLSMFTHLGNACPKVTHRHDNTVQRVLSRSDRLRVMFIADGVHVPLFALRNYLRAGGLDRCVVVSDAIAPAGLGPGRYRLAKWEVEVRDDLAIWAPQHGYLVGSAMSLAGMAQKLRDDLRLPEPDVNRLISGNPAAALSLTPPAYA